jgi:hypothetical protein
MVALYLFAIAVIDTSSVHSLWGNVPLAVLLVHDYFVAKKSRCFFPSIGYQGLFFRELQLEFLSQEFVELLFDLFCFFLRSHKTESGSRENIAAPRPPQNRACPSQDTRLKRITNSTALCSPPASTNVRLGFSLPEVHGH